MKREMKEHLGKNLDFAEEKSMGHNQQRFPSAEAVQAY